jgi:serine/threonine protein kinase
MEGTTLLGLALVGGGAAALAFILKRPAKTTPAPSREEVNVLQSESSNQPNAKPEEHEEVPALIGADVEIIAPSKPTTPKPSDSKFGSTGTGSISGRPRPKPSQAHPTEIGPFINLEYVGEGAMATVYRALDTRNQQVVALKLVLPSFQNDPEFAKRFEREGQISGALNHPNIVKIYETAQHAGRVTMSMEFIEGRALDVMLDEGTLPFSQIVRIAGQLIDGLHYAHQRDLVHRDIKPNNILVTQNGIPKLLDFGLALQAGMNRFTTVGASMGTPTHMSPETLTTGNSDKKSDQYAMGVVLFQMITGECPFLGPDAMSIAMQHVKSPPPSLRSIRPDTPERLEKIVGRMLKKDPAERYPALTQIQMELMNAV